MENSPSASVGSGVGDFDATAAWPILRRPIAFVGGSWIAARDGAVLQVEDPATGDHVGAVANCGAGEATQAVEAATTALPAWRERTALERADVLMRWPEGLIWRRS